MRRKQLSYLLSAVVIVSLMTGSVSAKEQSGIKECFECCRFTTPFHTSAQEHEIEFTKEETVYIDSEEEILTYPRDMYTRYTFILQPKTRATMMCSSCGGVATWHMATEQTRLYSRGCYYVSFASDIVSVYARNRYTECICGHLEITFIDNSYSVYCVGDGITYGASYSTTVALGYDIHQDMHFWD